MMKRYAVLGIIIALVVSIAAIGCSSGSSKPKSTPTKTPAHTATATPTTAPTENPEEVGDLPANYTFSMQWSDSNGGTAQMQQWVKGEKWRTDWSATGEEGSSEFKMIYDGEFAYWYIPSQSQVIKYTTETAMGNPGQAYAQEFEDGYWGEVSDETILAGFQAACSGTASIDGQEDVNGISCTKFTCNFADGSVSHYWIADGGWLVKGEVTSAEGYTYTMQYSDISFDDIDDSTFDISIVAPGVEITEVP